MKKNYGLNIGDVCRLKKQLNYCYAKILNIDYYGKNYKIAKCEWVVNKDDNIGFIKYFALRDLIKIDNL